MSHKSGAQQRFRQRQREKKSTSSSMPAAEASQRARESRWMNLLKCCARQSQRIGSDGCWRCLWRAGPIREPPPAALNGPLALLCFVAGSCCVLYAGCCGLEAAPSPLFRCERLQPCWFPRERAKSRRRRRREPTTSEKVHSVKSLSLSLCVSYNLPSTDSQPASERLSSTADVEGLREKAARQGCGPIAPPGVRSPVRRRRLLLLPLRPAAQLHANTSGENEEMFARGKPRREKMLPLSPLLLLLLLLLLGSHASRSC